MEWILHPIGGARAPITPQWDDTGTTQTQTQKPRRRLRRAANSGLPPSLSLSLARKFDCCREKNEAVGEEGSRGGGVGCRISARRTRRGEMESFLPRFVAGASSGFIKTARLRSRGSATWNLPLCFVLFFGFLSLAACAYDVDFTAWRISLVSK